MSKLNSEKYFKNLASIGICAGLKINVQTDTSLYLQSGFAAWIEGSLINIISIFLVFIIYFINDERNKKSKCNQPKDMEEKDNQEIEQDKENENKLFGIKLIILIIMMLFFFLYVGQEVAFGTFISVFAVRCKLGRYILCYFSQNIVYISTAFSFCFHQALL